MDSSSGRGKEVSPEGDVVRCGSESGSEAILDWSVEYQQEGPEEDEEEEEEESAETKNEEEEDELLDKD